MQLREIVTLVVYLLILLAAIVSFVITLAKKVKQYKEAKTDAEREAAINDMSEAARRFIAEAEQKYEEYTKMLVVGGTPVNTSAKTGVFKKDSVMGKLLQYAQERGYTFDSEYWSGKVDELVELTNVVNTSKK